MVRKQAIGLVGIRNRVTAVILDGRASEVEHTIRNGQRELGRE
jgi:hypothetical protein